MQFLFPAALSRQAQGDKMSLNVVGQGGNIMGRVEEGHRKHGRDSQGAGCGAGGDSGTCDLIR